MKYKVFVDGHVGTTGLRIFERLGEREDVILVRIAEEHRKDIEERARLINSSDISFLCLPDDAAREIMPLVHENIKVIDTSTAHRIAQGWVYGLPELSLEQRRNIETSNRVAVPGCHSTGFILAAAPLIRMGIVEKDYPFSCHSITGFSGGGKKMIEQYTQEGRAVDFDSPRQYALDQKHKHLPEMTEILGLAHPPIFNPIVGDFYSGMVVTTPIFGRYLKGKTLPEVGKMIKEFYQGQALINVHDFHEIPSDSMICANSMVGKDSVEIFITGTEEQGMIITRFDNLGKGACGAALQVMNIMLGIDEKTGLSV